MAKYPKNNQELCSLVSSVMSSYLGVNVDDIDSGKLDKAIEAAVIKFNTRVDTLPISFSYFGEQSLMIGCAVIPVSLVEDGSVGFNVREREERLADLDGWIVEARDGRQSICKMLEDRNYLSESEDDFVLEREAFSGYIAADIEPEAFNKACRECLEAALAALPMDSEYREGIVSALADLECIEREGAAS